MTPLETAAAALDPNWFYSSLAQSAASFVGLFGGILAASVQAQYEPAALQREIATAALRALNAQLRIDQRCLTDYREHAPNQIAVTRAGMADGKPAVCFEKFYHPFGVVPDNNGGQACTPAIIDLEVKRLTVTEGLVPLIDTVLKAKNTNEFAAFLKDAARFTETSVEGMGAIARKLVEFTERSSFELERLELRTRTRTWGILLAVLFVVVLTGLVGPLLELSVHNACGWLGLGGAGFFALGLLALLIYICVQIALLRRRARYETLLPPA